jgi:hypothetical protein
MNKYSLTAIAATRRSLLLVTSLGLLALPSCATSDSSSLPVRVGSGQAALSSLRTHDQNGRVTVAGSARPVPGTSGNHVDIELLGADGRVVAQKTERIATGHPRGSRARHGSDSFVASFPAETSRQAASVRVSFHGGAHSDCAGGQS